MLPSRRFELGGVELFDAGFVDSYAHGTGFDASRETRVGITRSIVSRTRTKAWRISNCWSRSYRHVVYKGRCPEEESNLHAPRGRRV
jgi:hypothetical protein